MAHAAYVCKDVTTDTTTKLPSDFLFLIDNSGSMQDKINGVVSGIKAFVASLGSSDIDARYAVVTFAGNPVLLSPFTSDTAAFYTAMSAIVINKDEGQEASFEAMRMALTNDGSDMTKRCAAGVNCVLTWRTATTKIFIHATDEDSDLPINSAYRMPGQTVESAFCAGRIYGACFRGFEPAYNGVLWEDGQGDSWNPGPFQYYRNESTFRLAAPYENEIIATASMLNANGVFLNSLVSFITGAGSWNDLPVQSFNFAGRSENLLYKNRLSKEKNLKSDDMTAAIYQFGNPEIAVQNADFSGFDAVKTSAALQKAGLQNSLQNRMLTAGNFMRVFDIALFSSSDKTITNSIISAFYTQVVQTTKKITQQCVFVPDPVVVSSTPTLSTTPSYAVAGSTSTALPQTTSSSATKSAYNVPYAIPSVVPPYSAAYSIPTELPPTASESSIGKNEPEKEVPLQKVLTVANFGIAGGAFAAGCALAIAVGLIVKRRANRPREKRLGSSAELLTGGGMGVNPLFKGLANTYENALYQGAGA